MKRSLLLAALLVLSACEEKIENNLTLVANGFEANNDQFMYTRLYATATSKDASDSSKFGGAIAGGSFTSTFEDLEKDVDFTVDYFIDRNNDGKCSPTLDLAWSASMGKVPETTTKTVTNNETYDWAACARSFAFAVTGPSISGKYDYKVTITGLDAYNGDNVIVTLPDGITTTTVVADGMVSMSAKEAMEASSIILGLWVDYNKDSLCQAPESTEPDGVFSIEVPGGAPADVTFTVSDLPTNGNFCTGPKEGNVTLQDLGNSMFSGSIGKRVHIAVLDGAVEQFRVSAVVPATQGVKFFVYNQIDVPASGTAPMVIRGFADTDGNGHCNGSEDATAFTYNVESRADTGGINRDFGGLVIEPAVCASTFP